MLPLRVTVDLGAMAMKGCFAFPKGFSITEATPSDCLRSYPGPLLMGSYLSAYVQSAYSTALADMATERLEKKIDGNFTGILPAVLD